MFHAFLFDIRNDSHEIINIERREAELNIISLKVNNFVLNKKRHGISVLLYATNTKKDLGRKRLTKHSKFWLKHKFFS